MRDLDLHLMQELTKMLHEGNPYIQAFGSLGEWALRDQLPMPYQMVIHADKHSTSEHARRYNHLTCSEIAAVVPVTEN